MGSYAQSLAKVVVRRGFNGDCAERCRASEGREVPMCPLVILALSTLFGARFIAGVDEIVGNKPNEE